MLRRVPRALRTAVIIAVLLAISASIAQSWASGTPGTAGYTQTAWGPLGPADRDLLVKVRLAGLWEAPTGQQARQQASRAEVQTVGTNIHHEHVQLDQLVMETADQLGVLVPSRPTAEQLSWMNEMSGLTGTDYDRVFVQRLRAAHGVVLPLIAAVRVGTRNELVRQFAAEANEYVTRHIGYLESTGLVDYSALPEPPSPGLLSAARGPADLVVPGLVVLAAVLAAAALISAMRRRPVPVRRPTSDPTARAIAAIAIPGPRVAEPVPRTTVSPHTGPIDPVPYDTGPHPLISETGPRHAVRR
jgi:predicted outer membrane protein